MTKAREVRDVMRAHGFEQGTVGLLEEILVRLGDSEKLHTETAEQMTMMVESLSKAVDGASAIGKQVQSIQRAVFAEGGE